MHVCVAGDPTVDAKVGVQFPGYSTFTQISTIGKLFTHMRPCDQTAYIGIAIGWLYAAAGTVTVGLVSLTQ